jgi:DNA-binding XRE family transcriptional regulator
MLDLKEWRLRNFLTQQELATKARMCRDTVNQVERGRQKPAMRTIRKLAKALKVKPGDIRFTKK